MDRIGDQTARGHESGDNAGRRPIRSESTRQSSQTEHEPLDGEENCRTRE